MNRVILMGRLTKEPELRATQSGVPVCNFTVACDRRYQKQGEERQADFVNCVAWRQQAEFLAKYFGKGHRICCEGSIQTRSWTDEEGAKQYATEVMIDHVEFAQSKAENGGVGASAGGYVQQQVAPGATGHVGNASAGGYVQPGNVDEFMPEEDDSLPF